jgi:HTTM domain
VTTNSTIDASSFADRNLGFLFREGSYFDLGILRIIAVAASLLILIIITRSGIQETLSLPEDFYKPLPALKILMLPFGWGTRPEPWLVNSIYWVTIATGITALVGFRTNISLLTYAIGNIFLTAFIYSFSDLHHREAVMAVMLLALAISPCGRVLSVDNRMGKGFNGLVDSTAASSTHSPYAYWPILLLQIFFALMYFSAVVWKHKSGLGWANGFTLQAYLAQDGIRHNSPLALWLSQFHYFIYSVQLIVVTFQATFFLIIFFPKLRWIYIPLGLVFHIGILLTLTAPFYQWIALYFGFIPWSNLREIISRRRRLIDLF